MNAGTKEGDISLSDAELKFQKDPENWRYGPAFNIRFFFDHPLDFASFEQAIFDDPVRIQDSRFNEPERVLFRHASWPTCIGARYYDFELSDRREPTIVICPSQYKAIVGESCITHGAEVELGGFIPPMVSLAQRLKNRCQAREVLLFLEDYYPSRSPETQILPGVFVSEPIHFSMNSSSD